MKPQNIRDRYERRLEQERNQILQGIKKNNPQALFQFAESYERDDYGFGHSPDPHLAQTYYQKAADLGHEEAQFTLCTSKCTSHHDKMNAIMTIFLRGNEYAQKYVHRLFSNSVQFEAEITYEMDVDDEKEMTRFCEERRFVRTFELIYLRENLQIECLTVQLIPCILEYLLIFCTRCGIYIPTHVAQGIHNETCTDCTYLMNEKMIYLTDRETGLQRKQDVNDVFLNYFEIIVDWDVWRSHGQGSV